MYYLLDKHILFDGYDPAASVVDNMLQFRLTGPKTEYGYVQDLLDLETLESIVMLVSRCRGNDDFYGDISDLNIADYDIEQLSAVAYGRGSNVFYGNVDDLDPKRT